MTLHKKGELFDLICKNPGEMSFIDDCETYDDYLKTYTDAGFDTEIAAYTESEFNALKSGFKSAKK